MRYVVDFGSANAGGAPSWLLFARLDTLDDLPPHPTFVEIGSGQYYFDYNWTTAPSGLQSITYKATLNGIELSDVISSAAVSAPVATTSVAATSTQGFRTAGELINRAAVQVGLASVPDPYASEDQGFVQLREFLNTIGDSLNSEGDWPQLIRECVFTTSLNATSYALPEDFQEMIPESGWNRSQRLPLIGPISSQEAQTIKAQLAGVVLNTPFRLQANLMTFPIAPPNGLVIAFEYISTFWIQSAASTTGPDLSSATAASDIVLYDPLLVVTSLKLQYLTTKGFDTSAAMRDYRRRLEYAVVRAKGSRTLRMGGGRLIDRYLDRPYTPPTGFGS